MNEWLVQNKERTGLVIKVTRTEELLLVARTERVDQVPRAGPGGCFIQ